jgi:lipopolysaccharide assembly protein A
MSSDRVERDQHQGLDTGTKVKLVLAGVVAVIIVIFALSNTDKQNVDYVVGDSDMPLIVVIAISFVAGILVDRLVGFIGRFRRDD